MEMTSALNETAVLEHSTVRRITIRLIPFLAVLFLFNFIDRTNVAFAALRMRVDVGISPSAYGLGAGIFFIGYCLCEIPSNVALYRFGARRWIARILVSWGFVASLTAFVQSSAQFIGLRFLLGIAEAGFYPGVIYFLSLWFPASHRARVTALFYLGVPIAQVIGAPLSTWLIETGDSAGLVGWRLMFLVEGLPAILLGISALYWLTDSPAQANWLSAGQRLWLIKELESEEQRKPQAPEVSYWRQISQSLGNRNTVSLALIYFGITWGSNAMNFFLPSVIQSFKSVSGAHFGLLTTGLLTAIPYAIASVAMVVWGRHSDHTQERRFHVGGAAIVAAVAVAFAFSLNSPIAILLGFSVMAAGIYSAINVFWSVPSGLFHGVSAAAAIGMINAIGNLSGFGGTYLVGFLFEKTNSYAPAFLMISCCVGLAGMGFIWFLRPRGHA
jgi:ACS family tartrate transporter-like MFS transporter